MKLNETIYPPVKTVQPGNLALYLWLHAEDTTIKLKSLTFGESFVNDFGVAKYKEVMASAEFETETKDLGYSIAYFKIKNGWKIVSFD